MARGGLSKDPAIAARQREALERGRTVAAARRAAGLPTKRREQQLEQSGLPATSGGIRRGTYTGKPGKPADTGKQKPAAATSAKRPGKQSAKPEAGNGQLGKLERAYAKLAGLG